MKLRDLSKVKNELLIELEDFLLDNLFDMEALNNADENAMQDFSQTFTKKVIGELKDNALPIAKIVFCDERGNDISEDELKKIPLKIELVKQALPQIMEILLSSIAGDEEEGKPQPKLKGRVKTKTK